MKLKKLVLHGFKSFADKTEFDFREGITVIVGPNGCGKSNVVDAVKWVLGEQRPASLRGKEMQDVIFSGTDSRKGLGYAEVCLVLDNADRSLPLEYEEVVITRRLYRSGESEYLINANPVRLRDVRELMMDSGGGPGALAVMEQGNIDRLLRADPIERRAVFEEAAGISKYRSRRKETERKLERTAENLARLRDVLGECETRERSLKIQAGKARRFKELSDELKRKRVAGVLARYGDLARRQEAAQAELEGILGAERQARDQLAEAIAQTDGQRALQEAARERVAAGEAEMAAAVGEGRAADEKRAAREREAEDLGARAEAAGREAEEARRRLGELERERTEAGRARTDSEGARAKAEEALRAAEALLREAEGRLQLLRAEREGLDLRRSEAFAAETQARNAEVRLDAERRALGARQDRLEERARSSAAALAELREAVTAALRDGKAAEERQRALEDRHLAAEAGARDARRETEVAAQDAAMRGGETAALVARRDLLQKLVEEGEGLTAGTRAVLEAAEAGTLAGVRGLLADLLRASGREAAQALDQALGEAAVAIVTETTAQAVAAIAWLKEGRRGRARFVPLDAVEQGLPALPAPLDEERVEPSVRPLVRSLLRGTRVARTLEDALGLAEGAAPALRVIALTGEEVGASGSLTGGTGDAGAGLIVRNAELAEIVETLAGAARAQEAAVGRVDAARARATDWEGTVESLRPALREARQAAREAGEALAAAQKAEAARAEEIAFEEEERAEVARLLEETGRDAEVVAARRASAQEASAFLEGESAGLLERLARSAGAREEAGRALTEARVEAARWREKAEAAAQRVAALAETIAATRRAADAREEEGRVCATRRQTCLDEVASLELMAQERRRALERQAREVEARRAAAAALQAQAGEAEGRVRELREMHERHRVELERHRLKETEYRMRLEALLEEVRREHGIDLAAAAKEEGAEAFDPEALEREIVELRERLERLGNVNHAALEELVEVEQRLAFLRKEEADLVAADAQLRDTIVKIDEVCVQRFQETFEKVRIHFREVFRKLFGGGKAEIFLENPADILGSGVEIVVRPPGKELRNMALLSGGEKTLTTVALLFAFYQTKPPPFCLMDEVDAALDESNTLRMCEMLKEYASQGQFLVITHARPTMTVADTLYGVTMPEAGISRRVAVRFSDIEAGRVIGLN